MNLSKLLLVVIAPLSILTACNTEASSGSGGSGGRASTTSVASGSTSSTGTGAPACVEDDLAQLGPFGGPGYDATQGGIVGTPLATYVVATTVLSRRPEAASKFLMLATGAIGSANQTDGFVGFVVATSKKCGTARTITVWKSEEAMMTFVTAPAHAACMAASSEVSSTGAFTKWNATPAELPPTFETARAKLVGVTPAY